MAVSEQRASSDLENDFVNEKAKELTQEKVEDDQVKSDGMLDEIAAKVEALDFSKIQEDEDSCDFHAKCMETVKKQGETINTLVQQLRIMFDEYQAVDQEREYYEDLNDALIRCLELTEGRIQFDSEVEESEKETEEDIAHLISKESEEICISQEKEEDTNMKQLAEEPTENETNQVAGATAAAVDEEGENAESEPTAVNDEEGENSESVPTKSEVKILPKSELIRLNRILLCEILELRHQIDVMKENIREYFDETEGSEYDTATDDEHVCDHCEPTRHDVTVNKDGNDDGKNIENDESEEYEILENEDDAKIKDEPDTE